MPIYEYECLNCGHKMEKEQKISEKPLKKCPECSKLKLQRLISGGTGIIFKGPGFYVTDNKKSKPPMSVPSSEGKSVEADKSKEKDKTGKKDKKKDKSKKNSREAG